MSSDDPTQATPKVYFHPRPPDPPEIDDVRFYRLLGKGGFGEVWLADDAGRRRCVIKVLDDRPSAIEIEAYQTYKNLCESNEDGLVPIGTMLKTRDGRFWYPMEPADDLNTHNLDPLRYEPCTLDAYIRRQDRLTADQACHVIEQLLGGLERLHRKGIAHCDIKPANILRIGGTWRLGDTGTLCHESQLPARACTPGYAPLGGIAHLRDDLYSVGKTLYEALSGSLDSFPGMTYMDRARNGQARAQLSKIGMFIARACAADPDARFQTATSMREHLESIRRDTPAPRGRRWAAAALLLAVVTIGAVGASVWLNRNQAPSTPLEASMVVGHYRLVDGQLIRLGTLGEDANEFREDDDIRLDVEFNRPTYCYLLALTPDGEVSLNYPASADAPPEPVHRFRYPAGDSEWFGLVEGSGLHAFTVVASADPLPAFAQWRNDIGALPWTKTVSRMPWQYDGTSFEPLMKSRGTRVRDTAPSPFVDSIRLLDRAQGVDTVFAVAFPIFPIEEGGANADGSRGPAAPPAAPPADVDVGQGRFGVFIGINAYPKLEEKYQLRGCVNDATNLQQIFRDRFGFAHTTLLTDAHATRAGIQKAFRDLVAKVTRAGGESDEPITVVIGYAGHGSQVKDQEDRAAGRDERDGRDETWISYDSSWSGENDIRDDDLEALWAKLIELNAQVVLISDSCHSGTMYRGASLHRTRTVERDALPDGPADALFPELTRPAPALTRGADTPSAGGVLDAEPQPGFVAYMACRDTERANEAVDEQSNPCGRFTLALRSVLADVGPGATFREVYEKIIVECDAQYPDKLQRPQFASSDAKRNELFLRGGYAPAHASIVPRSQAGRVVEVTMGAVHGVVPDAAFEFYADLDDLTEQRNLITRGEVVSVKPMTSRVRLPEEQPLASTTKARLDRVRMAGFSVRVDDSAGPLVREKIEALAALEQVEIAGEGQAPTVVIQRPEGSDLLGIYAPTALPTRGLVAAQQPKPLRAVRAGDPNEEAERLVENLLYTARVQRLMTLTYNERGLSTSVVVLEEDATGATKRRDPPIVDGITRLRDGEMFALEITNKTRAPLFLTVLYVDPDGTVVPVYPRSDDPNLALSPNRTQAIEFEAIVEVEPLDRTQLKVIASDRRLNLTAMLVPPKTGTEEAARTRGAGNALTDLFHDVLHGGPKTRGASRRRLPATWATTTVLFDVESRE